MKTNKDYITYRVIFVPDERLKKAAVKYAQMLAEYGDFYFKVDEINFFSHLTVYKAEYPSVNEDKIFNFLSAYSKLEKPFEIKYKGLFTEKGWTGFDFKRDDEVYAAHKKLVENLHLFREGHIREIYELELSEGIYTKGRKKMILQYGYPEVMDEYHPHLTLLRYTNEEIGETVVKKYSNKEISVEKGIIDTIALVQGGEHGTVTKFIRKYKLRA